MDTRTLDAVCSQVYRRFPAVNGCHPSIQAQGTNSLLIFRGKASSENGKIIAIVVRATVDASGKVVKMSSSR
jgi:hypothetical protein